MLLKKKSILKYIVDGIEISFDSDGKSSSEKNANEKILMKKILVTKNKYRTSMNNTCMVKLIFKVH